jgi:hypothetical protein
MNVDDIEVDRTILIKNMDSWSLTRFSHVYVLIWHTRLLVLKAVVIIYLKYLTGYRSICHFAISDEMYTFVRIYSSETISH